MGGGKTQTTTQQVQIPPEVLARYNAVNARAEAVAEQPFQAYSQDPNAFVAPLTATQQAGIYNVNQAAGAAQPYYQAGTNLTMGGAQNVGPLTQQQIQYYQNPYTQAVADPTIAALRQQQGEQTQGAIGNAIKSGAFGGDRAGIQMANLARQQGLGMAQAVNPIYQQAYQNALNAAVGQQNVVAQDLQRQLAAGQQLGGLGTGAQQAALSGAQAQLAAGTTEQQTQQAGLQALYNQFQQQRAYPFQLAQFLGNIAMGTGSLSGSTTTTTQPAGFFSDERLKENMRPVGETKDGQTIYSFNYKGDPRTQIGLSAQEVAEKHPEAVNKAKVPGLGGAEALTVDYKKATSDAAEKAVGGGLQGERIAPRPPMSAPMSLGSLNLTPIANPFQTQPPGGLGGAAPAMLTGNIPIQPFAGEINRAPPTEGVSLGTREGWQAELASLYNGRPFESGEQYANMRRQQLMNKLAGIDAQPMVITPPAPPVVVDNWNYDDNWARGGYVDEPGYYGAGGRPERARGGMSDSTWKAIVEAVGRNINIGSQSYAGASGTPGGGGGGGGYAAMGTKNPLAVAKLATASRLPSRGPSGLAQAASIGQQVASIAKDVYGGYKKITEKNDDKKPNGAKTKANYGGRIGYQGKGFVEGEMPYSDEEDNNSDFFRRDKGIKPVNAGSSDLTAALNDVNKGLASTPRGDPKKPPSSAPRPSGGGVNQLMNVVKTGKSLVDTASKAGSGLSSVLGGAGAEMAAGSGLGAAGAETVAGGLGALGAEMAAGTGAGLGMLGAEAVGAGAAGAAGALGAEAALGAVAAPALAEGGKAALAGLLALLSDPRSKHDDEVAGHLFNGQPVHTFKYNGDNKTRMGLMTTESDRRAVHNLGGLEMLDYKKATDVAAGLAPRQAAQRGGPFVDPDMPAIGAVETALNVPRQYQPIIAKVSEKTGVPANIIAALMSQESSFNPKAVGRSGEIGLTQILPSTARDPGYGMKGVDPESLRDPQANILFGANYLANKARHLGLDPSSPEALMAYNAGSNKERYAREVMAKAGRYDPTVDAKYANFTYTPAARAVESAKNLNRPSKGLPGDDRYRFSKEPGQFVKDTPRSAPWSYFGKGLLGKLGVSPDTASALTSEKFIVPLIGGIGSMLASRRPTLGGALGEGAIGGLSAYTALRKQEAEEEKAKGPATVQAETARSIAIGNVQKSVQVIGTTRIVWLANGTPMRYGEYMDLVESGKAPKLLGSVPTGPEAKKKLEEAGLPTEDAAVSPKTLATGKTPTEKKPAVGKTPTEKKPAVGKTPVASPFIDNKTIAVAKEDRKIVDNAGEAGAIATDAAKRYSTAVKSSAQAARDSARYMGDLAENLAKAAKGKGLNETGFGFNGRAEVVSALNTLARSFGLGPNVFGKADKIKQINEKISALQAAASAKGAGQESYAALDLLKKAIAQPSMDPQAFAKLSADLMVQTQRAIDRANHLDAYISAVKGATGHLASKDFERLRPSSLYTKEVDAISKIILLRPQLLFDIRRRKYTPKQIDDGLKKIFGLSNMSRYFIGEQ